MKTSSRISLFVIRFGIFKLFKLQLQFDVHSMIISSDMRGVELHSFGTGVTEDELIVSMCYAAYISHCRSVYRRPRLSEKKVMQIVNRLPAPEYKELLTYILNTRIFGKPIEEYASQPSKSKKKTSSR